MPKKRGFSSARQRRWYFANRGRARSKIGTNPLRYQGSSTSSNTPKKTQNRINFVVDNVQRFKSELGKVNSTLADFERKLGLPVPTNSNSSRTLQMRTDRIQRVVEQREKVNLRRSEGAKRGWDTRTRNEGKKQITTGSVSLLVDQISNLLDLKEVIIGTIKIIDPRLARTNNTLRSIDRF